MPLKATTAIGKTVQVFSIAIIVIASAVGVYAYTSQMTTTPAGHSTTISRITTSYSTTTAPYIYIENGSMSLCVSNCPYPSPHLSGTVFVNSTSPLKTLTLFVNGTFESTANYSNNFTNYAIAYKATPSNQSMPILAGKTYLILLVAVFQDGIQSTASTSVITYSNSNGTTTETTQSTPCCNDIGLNSNSSCDQLQASGYPSIVRLRHLIEASPLFIQAENGSNYVWDGALSRHDS